MAYTEPQVENDQAANELLAVIGEKKDKDKKKKTFGNVVVERHDGEKIILPEGMSYAEGRAWLEKIEKSEETVIAFKNDMKAYPWDGAYALFRAMQKKFGYADAIAERNASGSTPPTMISLKLPNDQFVSVPWGRLQFPGLDDKSYLETSYNHAEMKFVIQGQIKKKFEKAVQSLMLLTEKLLREESIYKGNAIKVDLGFLGNVNLSMTQPQFLNQEISGIKDEDVLMDDVTRLNYSSVLLRIEKTAECVTKGIRLKHGCLLAGPYGTGKSLTAMWTAKKAIANGWTFIYLEDVTQLKHALRLAEMYSPAIVFAEDVDKATEGGRTTDMNAILNTLDGIDTKTNPIITILTTNHLENINKAFLRAGRIDSLIVMTALNAKTGKQFLERFAKDKKGNSLLDPDLDFTDAAKHLTDIVPAFAYEVINKAKMYAMYNSRDVLTPDDIATAAQSFKDHIILTTENTQATPEQIIASAVETVNRHGLASTDHLRKIEADVTFIRSKY